MPTLANQLLVDFGENQASRSQTERQSTILIKTTCPLKSYVLPGRLVQLHMVIPGLIVPVKQGITGEQGLDSLSDLFNGNQFALEFLQVARPGFPRAPLALADRRDEQPTKSQPRECAHRAKARE